jgi:hypothetical protein
VLYGICTLATYFTFFYYVQWKEVPLIVLKSRDFVVFYCPRPAMVLLGAAEKTCSFGKFIINYLGSKNDDHLGYLDVEGRISKWILLNCFTKMNAGFNWLNKVSNDGLV